MKMLNKYLFTACGLALPSIAFAHPGHTAAGFSAAFAHPFTGIDHLLMMLFVGVWAGRTGGKTRWQLPLAFLMAMLTGWALAASSVAFAGIEGGIAAGLIALGVIIAMRATLSRPLQFVIVAGFAFLHGMAHGVELGAGVAPAFGFLLAGVMLHAAGIALATLLPREGGAVYRSLGAALVLFGGGMLIAI